MGSTSITDKISRTRVSSVLNRDVKQFGKQFLFDGDDETCWNSDQGSPQWILLEFEEEVSVSEIHVQFQGGFSGKECWIEAACQGEDLQKIHNFYPENINPSQVFKLPTQQTLQKMKIVFNSSMDFFGRITIYKLDVIQSV
ncbi:nuclear receptor 2C2-associated protein isoform X2 [Aplysia californica]|uniref:Nuclear receptor 2C2-associated protein isoform X2 n=1 Tax=Aplysia californica TaxID=6500 RepID=A0ABM0JC31_APLCA|nr:nuclear receptor 2C2-associated protein isoform X2 [Aplysia californica]